MYRFKLPHVSPTRTSFLLAFAFAIHNPIEAAPPEPISGAMQPFGNVLSYAIAANATPANIRAVFIADTVTEGYGELWSSRLSGGAIPPTRLSETTADGALRVQSFQLTKSGTRAVFLARLPSNTGPVELYKTFIDGNGAATKISGDIVNLGRVQEFLLSDDSQYAVFLADKDVDQQFELYSVRLDSNELRRISGVPVAGRDVTQFAISPDSSTVTFVHASSSGKQWMRTNIAGESAPSVLSPSFSSGAQIPKFAFTSNSDRLIYLVNRNFSNVYELLSVSIVASGGTSVISSPLVAGGSVRDFAISANSSRVVFLADKEQVGVTELYSTTVTGSSDLKLSGPSTSVANVKSFKISPDSSRVAYTQSNASGDVRMFSSPLTSSSPVAVCSGFSNGESVAESDFAFSRNAQHLVFTAGTGPSGSTVRLFSSQFDTGSCIDISGPLSSGADVVGGSFAITPDSRRVLFLADKHRLTKEDLFSVRIGGGAITKLSGEATSAAIVSDFEISPNPEYAVFRRNRFINNQSRELYAVSINANSTLLDVDGDGDVNGTTDHLMLVRYQLGVRGAALTLNAVGPNATRTTAAAIESYLQKLSEGGSLD